MALPRALAPVSLVVVLAAQASAARAAEPPAAQPSAAVATSTRAVAADPPRAQAAFRVIAEVLAHPRCRNCHPDGDRPLLGDPPQPHRMNVQRRLDEVGMACSTCHQATNAPGPHAPPGAPHWGLPPRAQVFEGRTPAELCRMLRDPATNGGRSLEALHHHLTADPLVLWGWAPGEGRAPVSVPLPDFARAVRTWIDAGAYCPEETP